MPDTGRPPDVSPLTPAELERTRRDLAAALDLLEERLLPAYTCDGLESELWALREKIDAAELAQLRTTSTVNT